MNREDHRGIIDLELKQQAHKMGLLAHPSPLREALSYVLSSPGKRVRGQLCMLVGEALGHVSCLDLATAVEMVHAYSLVHDDLPCMDDDHLRRGLPTVHVAYNEATALLVGDALLTHGFGVIARSSCLSDASKLKIILELSKAAGADGMIAGQSLDLYYEKRKDITLENIEHVHRLKTGKLFEVCWVGPAYANNRDDLVEPLRALGSELGLCFQIQDDLLDNLEGTGKTQGKDRASEKGTYLSFMDVQTARAQLDAQFMHIQSSIQKHIPQCSKLLSFLDLLFNRAY